MPPSNENPFRRAVAARQQGNPFRREAAARRETAAAAPAADPGLYATVDVLGEMDEPTFREGARAGFFDRFVDNALGLADLGVRGAMSIVSGRPLVDGFLAEPLVEVPEELRGREPMFRVPDRVLPTREQIQAGTATAGEVISPMGENPISSDEIRGRYAEHLARVERRQQRLQEAQPAGYRTGEVGADIASLITGRAPVSRLIQRAEQRLAPKAAEIAFGSAASSSQLAPGVARVVERTLQSPALRSLARGAGRSLEAGLEATVLEIVKGDDPLEAAAFAAGGQALGSVLLSGGKGLLSGGATRAGAKITLAAASIAGLVQLVKSATPGGRDRILESVEAGYDKVAFGILTGALAAMAGAGRGRDAKLAEDLPELVDAVATAPRAAMLSFLTDWSKASEEEQTRIEGALERLGQNPDWKPESAADRALADRVRGLFGDDGQTGGGR